MNGVDHLVRENYHFLLLKVFFLEIIEQLISADTRFIYEGFSIYDNNLYLDK